MNPANIISIIVTHYKYKRRSTEITAQERKAAEFIINVIEDTVATDGTNIYHEHTIHYIEEYENAVDLPEETDDDPSVDPEPAEEMLVSDGSQSSGYLPSSQKRKKWGDIPLKKQRKLFRVRIRENETIELQYSS